MIRLKVDTNDLRESETAIDEAIRILAGGGAVVYPTDTLYGLGVDATDGSAVAKIFKIKKRPEAKALPILIANIEWAKKLAYVDKKIEKILAAIWPGAVTVLLQHSYRLPSLVTAGQRTIALRIPDYKLAYFLLEKFGKPLTATSANISGQLPSNKIEEVLAQFNGQPYQPTLVLDAGDLLPSEPSTILDLSGPQPRITRIGPVSKEKLLKILAL